MNENKVILLTLILCHSSLKVTSLAQKQHAFTKDPFNLLKRTSRTSRRRSTAKQVSVQLFSVPFLQRCVGLLTTPSGGRS